MAFKRIPHLKFTDIKQHIQQNTKYRVENAQKSPFCPASRCVHHHHAPPTPLCLSFIIWVLKRWSCSFSSQMRNSFAVVTFLLIFYFQAWCCCRSLDEYPMATGSITLSTATGHSDNKFQCNVSYSTLKNHILIIDIFHLCQISLHLYKIVNAISCL